MSILNSIGIFVKLNQEYRGGSYIYSDGKGLDHHGQRTKMALATLESFLYIVVHVTMVHLPSPPFSIHVMTHFKNQFKMAAMNNN